MAQTVNHIKGNISLVLMHSGIVNGYQLLCDAHTVLEPHRGTAAFFLFYSLSSFSTFSFYVFVTLDSPFLGCLYSLCKQSMEDSRLSCESPTGHLSVNTLGTTALK